MIVVVVMMMMNDMISTQVNPTLARDLDWLQRMQFISKKKSNFKYLSRDVVHDQLKRERKKAGVLLRILFRHRNNEKQNTVITCVYLTRRHFRMSFVINVMAKK